jgi:hypothetical protein
MLRVYAIRKALPYLGSTRRAGSANLVSGTSDDGRFGAGPADHHGVRLVRGRIAVAGVPVARREVEDEGSLGSS